MKDGKRTSFIVRIAAIILVIAGIAVIARMQMQYNELRAEIDELGAAITQKQEKVDALQRELDAPFDEEYIISIARKKLNLCLPEEIIFYNDISD